jgi:hypothetical protein
LLRFSTPSLAEKNQWIQLISESCEYCETDAFLEDEAKRLADMAEQQRQQANMANAMPEASRGTLPPLYFAPPVIKPQKRPSHVKLSGSKMFRTTSKSNNLKAEEVDANSIKGYPPSKPMHRSAATSYLSTEAPVQNYRGLFNL